MSIVAPADFIGEQNIPNVDKPATAENLQWFIDEYEPSLLEAVMGPSLYADYLAGVALDPIPQKWIDIQNNADLKRSIVCLVFYYWLSNEIAYTSGIGVQKAKGENSVSVGTWDKQVKSWNTMVKRLYKVREFIDAGDYDVFYTDLPQYVWELPFVNCNRPEYFVPKNTLNL